MEATDKLGPTSTLVRKAARTIEVPRSGSVQIPNLLPKT